MAGQSGREKSEMKKILLLDTSYPINTRNSKILSSLTEFEKFVITWNRDNRPICINTTWKECIYISTARYGNNILKLLKLFSYTGFIKKYVRNIKPDIIIASHWEMLMVSSFVKPKNCKLVYENLDIPTHNNVLILKLLQKIERISLNKTEGVIFASRFFTDLYSFYKKRTFVIENKPFRAILTDKPAQFHHNSERLKISFVGTIRYFDCMRNLITAASGLPVDILFFGEGPDYQPLLNFAKNYNNIYFFGKYNYDDIKCIYELSDIIWAVYPNKDYNVKYAISNKFFESLVFEKPAFFADNTELGNFVAINGIGFTIDPYNIDDIKNSFLKILDDRNNVLDKIIYSIKQYNSCNSLFWEDDIQKLQEVFK